MKRLVDVYQVDPHSRWPWVSDCDRCLQQKRHSSHEVAMTYATEHAKKHETVGFRP
jgi:hypothetical protein